MFSKDGGLKKTNGSKIHQLEEILAQLRKYIEEEKAYSRRPQTRKPIENIEKSLVHTIPALFLFLRSDYSIEFVNNSSQKWPGYTPESMRNNSMLDYIHPDDLPAFQRKIDLVSQGNTSRSRISQIRIQQENGEWQDSYIEAWAHGELSDVQGIFLMIRKLDSNAVLSGDYVKEQKMEALGFIAGSMAHDFRNIMAVILGATQMIEMNPTEKELQKYLDMITSSVNRGNAIIKRMLTYAQTPKPSLEEIQINSFIGKYCKKYRSFLPSNISLKLEEFPEDAHVLADPDHLREVLDVICDNAVEAMPEGGELQVTVEEPLPALSYAGREERFLTLMIQDTGMGMSKETLEKIFNPFFSTKETGDAVGLSLPLSYNLIQHMGGWIEVQSEKGLGTKVSIGIPRVAASGEQTLKADRQRPTRMTRKDAAHILIVEDEAHLRELLAELLKAKGYEVSVAANGRDGLNIFQGYAEEIDLIVTDLKMPTLSGYDLERTVHSQYPEQKIIAITGSIQSGKTQQEKMIGFDAIIEKPFDIPEILSRVSEVLERSTTL
ncbi:MAG: response regulator [Candidatus Marinimicrobia bacterium]|nr:response regulator [Candidatus Neomarinimicrobiota bacterium]